jgi:hypothetical protein
MIANHKANFWDFLESPVQNKLAVLVLFSLVPFVILMLFLEWIADKLMQYIVAVSGWVKTWW